MASCWGCLLLSEQYYYGYPIDNEDCLGWFWWWFIGFIRYDKCIKVFVSINVDGKVPRYGLNETQGVNFFECVWEWEEGVDVDKCIK